MHKYEEHKVHRHINAAFSVEFWDGKIIFFSSKFSKYICSNSANLGRTVHYNEHMKRYSLSRCNGRRRARGLRFLLRLRWCGRQIHCHWDWDTGHSLLGGGSGAAAAASRRTANCVVLFSIIVVVSNEYTERLYRSTLIL